MVVERTEVEGPVNRVPVRACVRIRAGVQTAGVTICHVVAVRRAVNARPSVTIRAVGIAVVHLIAVTGGLVLGTGIPDLEVNLRATRGINRLAPAGTTNGRYYGHTSSHL